MHSREAGEGPPLVFAWTRCLQPLLVSTRSDRVDDAGALPCVLLVVDQTLLPQA